jgi:hypothetical protein
MLYYKVECDGSSQVWVVINHVWFMWYITLCTILAPICTNYILFWVVQIDFTLNSHLWTCLNYLILKPLSFIFLLGIYEWPWVCILLQIW